MKADGSDFNNNRQPIEQTKRIFSLTKAERKKAKVKIAIIGPSGSGKSFTALRLATGIISKTGGKIALIDTENRRSEYYANEFDFDILALTLPFSPESYIQAIETVESKGYDVCIIDSGTHEWKGEGGILDSKEKMNGSNEFAKWAHLTPRHNAFIDKIARSNIHIILTLRGKDQYVLEQKENGKQGVKKVGLGPDQRDGIEYEFTATFLLDLDGNVAQSQKDNTHIFNNSAQLTEEHGRALYDWADQGKEFVSTKKELDIINKKINNIVTACNLTKAQEDVIRKKIVNLQLDPIKLNEYIMLLEQKSNEKLLQKEVKQEPEKKTDEMLKRIKFLNDLIMSIPEKDREQWIDEHERCKTLDDYNRVIAIVQEEIKSWIVDNPTKKEEVDFNVKKKEIKEPTNPIPEKNIGLF
jgi:energy-coupling factor transporter ATP-binding protein EcfA2